MSGYPSRDTTSEVVHLVGGYVYHATGYLSGGSCIWYLGCQDTHLRTPHLRWYIWWVDLWIPCQDTSQEDIPHITISGVAHHLSGVSGYWVDITISGISWYPVVDTLRMPSGTSGGWYVRIPISGHPI